MAEGGLRALKASPETLAFVIFSSGRFIPLNRFGAKQFSYGVRAKPWGRSQQFKSAFIIEKFGSNVFVRENADRRSIKKLWGPSVPRELVRDESAAAFHAEAAERLPSRVAHNLRRIVGDSYS